MLIRTDILLCLSYLKCVSEYYHPRTWRYVIYWHGVLHNYALGQGTHLMAKQVQQRAHNSVICCSYQIFFHLEASDLVE